MAGSQMQSISEIDTAPTLSHRNLDLLMILDRHAGKRNQVSQAIQRLCRRLLSHVAQDPFKFEHDRLGYENVPCRQDSYRYTGLPGIVL